jgi:hypothetical protein
MTITEIEQRAVTPTLWTIERSATSVDFAVKTF